MTAIRCALPRAVELFFAGAIVGGVAHLLYLQRRDTTAHDETQFLKHALVRASSVVERDELARADDLPAGDLQDVILIPLWSLSGRAIVACTSSSNVITTARAAPVHDDSADAAPQLQPPPPQR